jgi:hypothetical protein
MTFLSGSIPSVVGLSILVNASPLAVDLGVRDAIIAGQIRVAPRLDRLHDCATIMCTVPPCCSRKTFMAASALAMLVCKC